MRRSQPQPAAYRALLHLGIPRPESAAAAVATRPFLTYASVKPPIPVFFVMERAAPLPDLHPREGAHHRYPHGQL